ncbi:MAG: MBL fold metallo-hydrolase [Eubacteriaceae bacterium]|nr:MBL fold metallo-hydrolase [Eubacteriaceae bacterium]
MKVIYLHHSGFLVQLPTNTVVFDAITDIQPHFLRKGRQHYFLASHSHQDHFAQRIFSYGTDYNSTYILSDDITKRGGSNVHYIKPYETMTFDHPKAGKIEIETFGSTDLGVSYVVKCEGKTIFHAGDLNWWDWDPEERPGIDPATEEADYKNEIARIAEKYPAGSFDLAFVPVDSRLSGHSPIRAAEYFIDTLKPKVLAPMHFWDEYSVIDQLQTKCFGKGTEILSIHKRNEIIYDDEQ